MTYFIGLIKGFRRVFVIVFCFLSIIGSTTDAFGSRGSFGATIFQNTFYGMGTGVLISALLMVANDQADKWAPTLAKGTLWGGAIGAGLGVYEVIERKRTLQDHARDNIRLGFQPPKIFFRPESDKSYWGITLAYNY